MAWSETMNLFTRQQKWPCFDLYDGSNNNKTSPETVGFLYQLVNNSTF